VFGIDVNGPGLYSNEVTLQACAPPTGLERPVISNILKEQFTMSWAKPAYTAGCPITEYKLYRDDGAGSDVNIQIDPDDVASRALIYEYDVVLDSSMTGLFINVKVEAINAQGSVLSKSTMLVLADVPGKPEPAPVVV
jgi:hypothetical protein